MADNYNDKSIFAHALQEAFRNSELTQFQFAEKIGIGENALKLMLNGTNYPSIPTFVQICEVLDVEPDRLLQGYLQKGAYDSDDEFYQILETVDCMQPENRAVFYKMLELLIKSRR